MGNPMLLLLYMITSWPHGILDEGSADRELKQTLGRWRAAKKSRLDDDMPLSPSIDSAVGSLHVYQ
jgi:hypothetical protein